MEGREGDRKEIQVREKVLCVGSRGRRTGRGERRGGKKTRAEDEGREHRALLKGSDSGWRCLAGGAV